MAGAGRGTSVSEFFTKNSNLNKNSAKCYVAPALCLHIRNSMKATV